MDKILYRKSDGFIEGLIQIGSGAEESDTYGFADVPASFDPGAPEEFVFRNGSVKKKTGQELEQAQKAKQKQKKWGEFQAKLPAFTKKLFLAIGALDAAVNGRQPTAEELLKWNDLMDFVQQNEPPDDGAVV